MKGIYLFYDSSDSTTLPEDCYESDVPILRFFRFYDFTAIFSLGKIVE